MLTSDSIKHTKAQVQMTTTKILKKRLVCFYFSKILIKGTSFLTVFFRIRALLMSQTKKTDAQKLDISLLFVCQKGLLLHHHFATVDDVNALLQL